MAWALGEGGRVGRGTLEGHLIFSGVEGRLADSRSLRLIDRLLRLRLGDRHLGLGLSQARLILVGVGVEGLALGVGSLRGLQLGAREVSGRRDQAVRTGLLIRT